MSKEAGPGTVGTVETTTVEYSNVIELTTFPKYQDEEVVLRPPTQFLETQFETYITMDEGILQRPSTSRAHLIQEEPHSSRQESSFHRYSTVENAEVIQYENTLHGTVPSEDEVIPRFGNSFGNDARFSDDLLSLRTRLKTKKRRLPFLEYACYAIEEVYQEVEKILILDIVFLIFSFGMAILGMKRVADCTYSPNVPVAIVVSGVIDAFVNILSICAALTKRPGMKEALLDIIRMGRLTLFLIHSYGLVKVYSILPPEESDRTSPEYCESLLYWMTFAYFHITTLSSVVVIGGMATAVACFHT